MRRAACAEIILRVYFKPARCTGRGKNAGRYPLKREGVMFRLEPNTCTRGECVQGGYIGQHSDDPRASALLGNRLFIAGLCSKRTTHLHAFTFGDILPGITLIVDG